MKTKPKKTAAQKYEEKKLKIKNLPESVLKKIDEFKRTYFNSTAVMAMYDICRTTLYNYRHRGLKTYSTTSRRIYFKWDDLLAMLGKPKKTGPKHGAASKAA